MLFLSGTIVFFIYEPGYVATIELRCVALLYALFFIQQLSEP